jgi:hypothetical protein
LYDPFANRWIFAIVSDPENGNSSVCIGASQTSDPTGQWNLFRFDADNTDTLWADYPTLGFNKDWIVVSVNMFTNAANAFVRGQVYAFDKAGVYANTGSGFTFNSVTIPFTLVPAVTYDNISNTVFLVRHISSASGTISKSTLVGSPPSAPTLTLNTAIITSGLGSWAVPSGEFLPQSGTARRIDVGDARMQSVVVRTVGGVTSVWCAQNVTLPAGITPTRAAAQWWQLDSNPSSTAILQQGRIEDPTATQTNGGKHFAYPSLTVNKNGDMLIGYSRFSSAQFASAAYSFRSATDPANTLQDDVALKAGEALYVKTFSGTENRWGDYSKTVMDPLNDADMWTIQEYAAAPSGGFDRWGTWWGQIVPPAAVTGSNFFTLTPCRVLDTRNANGPFGGPALSANADRSFVAAGQCGIPSTAKAISVNLTVTQPTAAAGDLRIYPTGTAIPNTSSINYRLGQTRANNAIIVLGSGGAFTVRCVQTSGTVHFILDVNGYFQ